MAMTKDNTEDLTRVDGVPEGEHGDLPRPATKVMHTPGPWWCTEEYQPRSGDRFFIDANIGSSARRDETTVAEIIIDPLMGDGEPSANARLVAAAPELLAALKSLVDVLNDDLNSDQCAAWDTAVAAIVKAEGAQ